jgi:hypothetical protein
MKGRLSRAIIAFDKQNGWESTHEAFSTATEWPKAAAQGLRHKSVRSSLFQNRQTLSGNSIFAEHFLGERT